jgi:beta-galactosidase
MARKLAERYQNHPALFIWHINNEMGCECYCDNCAKAFRKWLQKKYGTLEKLNEAWYTAFWSHTFYDWDEIVPPNMLSEHWTPRKTAFPSISLDYSRFNNQSVLDTYLVEYREIKNITPDIMVTTNFHGIATYKPLDYFEWAKYVDIVSWDNYPSIDTPVSQIAFRHDLMRGMKEGQPYIIMEQTPSQQNWQPYNSLKRPGVMRLLSYQAVAHGADGILFFQLKRSRGACEKLHGAVIDHVGHGETRVFRECAELGREFQQLGDVLIDSRIQSKVAILFDWENWWAAEYCSGPSDQLDYVQQVQKYYDAFYHQHIPVDIINVDADLSSYDIVITPVLYMVKSGYEDKLRKYVENGGLWITTFFTGVADETDLVTTSGYPGVLRELLGIWVEEIDALTPGRFNEMLMQSPEMPQSGPYRCDMLCEIVHLEGAQSFAAYTADFYKGMPAITCNQVGQGEAWYMATNPADDFLREFVSQLCAKKGITPLLSTPNAGIEVSQRHKNGKEYTFYLNHSDEVKTIDMAGSEQIDLLTKRTLRGEVTLEPKAVVIAAER